jgi:WD40 repeat protein
VRASYRPYNALDELEAPTVATFSPDGQTVVAGGFRTDRVLHVFQTVRPGRDSTIWRLGKTRRSSEGQKGLVSALTYSSDSNLLAVGTYSPGSIYIYDQRTQLPAGTILSGRCVVGHGKSHSRKKRRIVVDDDNNDDWLQSAKIQWFVTRAQGGITQLQFSSSYTLYSASRRSDAILMWDLRMLSGDHKQSDPIRGIGSFSTCSDTNQRLEFDCDDETMYVGGRDKCVRIYDIASGKQTGAIDNLEDASNGVSYMAQTKLLAVATGSRRFPTESELDNSDDSELDNSELENSELDNIEVEQGVPGCLRLYSLR